MEKRRLTCELDIALSMIGGKWKLLIIEMLASREIIRFGELRRLLGGVNQKSLTKQLRELEEDGLVEREVFAEVPPRVEYRLSPKGRSLQPILDQLCDWGLKNANFDYELLVKLCEDL